MIGAIGFLTAPECTKFVFCEGSTPDPAACVTKKVTIGSATGMATYYGHSHTTFWRAVATDSLARALLHQLITQASVFDETVFRPLLCDSKF